MAERKVCLPGEAGKAQLEQGFALLGEAVNCLSRSDEWETIQQSDVLIQKAKDDLLSCSGCCDNVQSVLIYLK